MTNPLQLIVLYLLHFHLLYPFVFLVIPFTPICIIKYLVYFCVKYHVELYLPRRKEFHCDLADGAVPETSPETRPWPETPSHTLAKIWLYRTSSLDFFGHIVFTTKKYCAYTVVNEI